MRNWGEAKLKGQCEDQGVLWEPALLKALRAVGANLTGCKFKICVSREHLIK